MHAQSIAQFAGKQASACQRVAVLAQAHNPDFEDMRSVKSLPRRIPMDAGQFDVTWNTRAWRIPYDGTIGFWLENGFRQREREKRLLVLRRTPPGRKGRTFTRVAATVLASRRMGGPIPASLSLASSLVLSMTTSPSSSSSPTPSMISPARTGR